MNFNRVLESVEQYYAEKIKIYGPTARGVDWNSSFSQKLRFEQLMKVCERAESCSILDYGCGYGALIDYLDDNGYIFQYRGFDICEQMIAEAKQLHQGSNNREFFRDESELIESDYTIASGIFNVKLSADSEEWKTYLLGTLRQIARLSKKGFAFNVTSGYSDSDKMQDYLYYADPLFLFDYCKREFSRYVSLLHDYPLYEFTIIVRKVRE